MSVKEKYTGLEQLVNDNISELKDGVAYIAVGKRTSGKGFKFWDMKVIYPEDAERVEFGNIRRLIRDDKKTILFNTYKSAWVGISEDGEYKSVKDVANRIKYAYENGICNITDKDVDRLMPKELYKEYKEDCAKLEKYNQEKKKKEEEYGYGR